MTGASRFLTGLVTCFATHAAFPRAPAIVVLCDNDQIHPTRACICGFHGDTGAGLGASRQTGWTALVLDLILESRRT